MNVEQAFKSALTTLGANKVRSGLTMLGVIIGVFAVVTMIALGRGLQNYITDQFEQIGSNLLFVAPGRARIGGDPAQAFSRNRFTYKHVKLIETYASDYISTVAPFVQVGETVKYKTKLFYASVNGIDYKSFDLYQYEIGIGRTFTRNEERSKKRVVIIGPSVKKELFPNSNPVRERISIGTDAFEVIGTFKEKGKNFDDGVLMPYTSSMNTFDLKHLTNIVAKAKTTKDLPSATRQIELALLRDLKKDDFSVLSQQDILSTITNILKILTIGLGAIAGVSLLVGGIGIMNIMLVSVTERIREIGLRKAVGATPTNIAMQFLIESVILSVSGGTIGLLLGWAASYAAQNYIRAEVTIGAVALAFGFAAGVGIVFGTYPAYRAGKLDPIEALRYE